MGRFIVIDGKVIEKGEVNVTHLLLNENVVLSQKIWFGFGGIPLFSENISLLIREMKVLQLPLPENFKNERELFRVTKRMLNKNKFYRSGLIFIQVFWNENSPATIITAKAYESFDFPFSPNGLFVNFSGLRKYSGAELARFPFYNEPLWKAAGLPDYVTQAGSGPGDSLFQNSIILNEAGYVCECIKANIFMMKGNTLITPALKTGCYDDLLRNMIIETAAELKINVAESDKITKDEILKMNEVFIAGEERGVQWILGIENKRFVHRYSEVIYEQLNDRLKNKAL